MRVAVGAICKRLLAEFGIAVGGYVTEIGGDRRQPARRPPDYPARFAAAEESEVRCPDPAAAARIQEAIRQAKIDKDTLGGVIEVVALGLPPGLGSHVHYDRRLTGRLAGGGVQRAEHQGRGDRPGVRQRAASAARRSTTRSSWTKPGD